MRPTHYSLSNRISSLARNITYWREWLDTNQPRLVRIAAILLVFGLSAYFVPRVAVGNYVIPLVILGGVIGLAAVSFAIQYPSFGFAIAIPVAMVVPFGIGTGTGSDLNGIVLIVAVLFGLWVLGMVVQRQIRFMSSSIVAPALLLMASALISFAFGQLPWFLFAQASLGAQIGGVMIFILSMGCLLTVAHTLTPRTLQACVWIFLGLSTVFIVARWQVDVLRPLVNRFVNGSIGSIFWVWLVTLAAGQLLFNRKLPNFARVWIGLLLAITMWVMLVQAQSWTSGWLPALAGLALMIWIGWKRLRIPIILAGLLIFALQWDNIQSMVMVGDNEYSLFSRLEAWEIMFRIIAVNPITGLGPANYYNYTPLYKIAGYAVRFNSHSQYIDLLAQVGIIGFAVYVWLMVVLQKLALDLFDKVPHGFLRGFIAATVGAVAGTVVSGFLGDWIIPFVYNVGMDGFRASLIGWIFLGGLAAVARWLNTDATLTKIDGTVT